MWSCFLKIKLACIGSACTVLMNSQKCLNVFGGNIPAKCGLLSDTHV